MASGPFLTRLQRLDELTFGPVGMPMPRWVFYDCAECPGGIFGFARPASQTPQWVRRALGVEDGDEGPVPVSMFVGIPMLEPGAWHTYTLCSVNEVAPGAAPASLRLLTAAAGLQVFGVRRAYGATQWRSPKLAVHARFGPMRLLTAWTPAHSDPTTLTFRSEVTPESIAAALDPPAPLPDDVWWIDCDDGPALRKLQVDIEAGRAIDVVGGAVIDGSYTRVPVVEATS